MKVGFSVNVNQKDANSGKHKFLIRMAKEFRKNGISIVDKKPDIYLNLPNMKVPDGAKIVILRLDGLIMNMKWDHKSKNKQIKKSIKQSHGLIYQGRFCKDAFERFLNIRNKNSVIIPNAADPCEFLPRDIDNFFLANCKWRPHKRLKDIIKTFLLATEMGIDSNLIITGKVKDKKIKHPRIKYVGWQKIGKLKKHLSGAIASLHFSWLDWCPNSMVEAIVAGCPVIYTKSGGHEELGKDAGIGISDKQWNFKLCNLYSPPPINYKEAAEVMIRLKKTPMVPLREDLYINNIAKRYMKYFERILSR